MLKSALLFLSLVHAASSQSIEDLPGTGNQPDIDRLTFSNTARWESQHLRWLRQQPRFLPRNWKQTIVLPVPPDNSSDRTKAELAELVEKAKERPNRLAEIKNELQLANFRFGQFTYQDLTTQKSFEKTGELMRSMYSSVACVTFMMKKRFNRVRPTVVAEKLAIELDPVIPNPGHPAYPSGHATGAFAIAFLLAELDPKNKQTYLTNAARIAENREIAGVHYCSDSEAGRLLARQLVDSFLRNRSFKTQVGEARAEWER